jgi:hypothetical protein
MEADRVRHKSINCGGMAFSVRADFFSVSAGCAR